MLLALVVLDPGGAQQSEHGAACQISSHHVVSVAATRPTRF